MPSFNPIPCGRFCFRFYAGAGVKMVKNIGLVLGKLFECFGPQAIILDNIGGHKTPMTPNMFAPGKSDLPPCVFEFKMFKMIT